MSILNLEKTRDHITNWIKDYAKTNGLKSLVVGLSGGIDSALVALLCKRTGLPTICVSMPCHSSPSSYERAKKFSEEQGLSLIVVDLGAAHDSIFGQASSGLNEEERRKPVAVGGLRSCLRAPTLSFFALATGGIIVGTGNRSEDNLIRYFQKYGDGCVDISPISDLFKSEVYELFAFMTGVTQVVPANWNESGLNTTGNREGNLYYGPAGAMQIYTATPTADLWGPDGNHTDEGELGISYDEIEWADRENMRTNIVSSNESPTKQRSWAAYTMRQREVIGKVHQLEKISRHKYNPNLPVCDVRNEDGLVK